MTLWVGVWMWKLACRKQWPFKVKTTVWFNIVRVSFLRTEEYVLCFLKLQITVLSTRILVSRRSLQFQRNNSFLDWQRKKRMLKTVFRKNETAQQIATKRLNTKSSELGISNLKISWGGPTVWRCHHHCRPTVDQYKVGPGKGSRD